MRQIGIKQGNDAYGPDKNNILESMDKKNIESEGNNANVAEENNENIAEENNANVAEENNANVAEGNDAHDAMVVRVQNHLKQEKNMEYYLNTIPNYLPDDRARRRSGCSGEVSRPGMRCQIRTFLVLRYFLFYPHTHVLDNPKNILTPILSPGTIGEHYGVSKEIHEILSPGNLFFHVLARPGVLDRSISIDVEKHKSTHTMRKTPDKLFIN